MVFFFMHLCECNFEVRLVWRVIGLINFVGVVDKARIVKMEVSNGPSPRHGIITINREKNEGNGGPDLQILDLETVQNTIRSDHHFHSTSALEILRETVRILRYNLSGFMAIAAVLICPVSTVLLSNVFIDQSLVKRLTLRLLLVANSSGLPIKPFIKQSCQKLSESVVSATMCLPLFATSSLLSKAAVVYSVDCTYSRKKFDSSKFYVIISKIWKRILITYLWVCGVISGCITLFLVLLVVVSSVFSVMGFPPDLILYPAMVIGLIFSVTLANTIIICNIAVVISVLEDVLGPQALLRSSSLIKGQTRVGLLIFLGSKIGMAFVEGLFEHRVKTLSYGDGSSRIWEGPLLVIMYSFVVLVDSMNSTVFYFSCKSYRMESANEESEPVLEALTLHSGSTDTQ